jgi:exodeoxyribonuclease VII small subunit
MPEQDVVVNKTYEEAFTELESIVHSLEAEQRTLDEAMRLFERGQALAQHCTTLLDQAELKVRQLGGEDLPAGEEADE